MAKKIFFVIFEPHRGGGGGGGVVKNHRVEKIASKNISYVYKKSEKNQKIFTSPMAIPAFSLSMRCRRDLGTVGVHSFHGDLGQAQGQAQGPSTTHLVPLNYK